ncbi:MAG: hypothetical protein K5891_06425 [Lachnospiraceae bacterium]|nr:hypothetical protein [Lachnospiraceae bacterium]
MSRWLDGFLQYTSGAKLLGIFALLELVLLCFPGLRTSFSRRGRSLLAAAGIWALLCLFPLTALGLMWYQSAYYNYTTLWEPAMLIPSTALGLGTLMTHLLCYYREKGRSSSLFRERVCPPLLVVLLLLLCLLCGDAGYGNWKAGALQADAEQLEALRMQLLTLTEGIAGEQRDTAPPAPDTGSNETRAAAGLASENHKPLIWGPREVLSYLPMAGADFALYYGRDLWDPSLTGYTYDTYDRERQEAEQWMYAVSLQDVFFFAENWSSVYFDEEAVRETAGNKNGITSCRKALDAGVDVIVLPCTDRTDEAGLSAICEALELKALGPEDTGCEGYYILLRTALAPQ